MLHCTATPGQKSEKKTISSSSGGLCVEKKIIDSKRSTASPVDMILKKLTEKVQSSPSPSSAISSPVSSPGSSYKFFKSKGGDEKGDDLAKKSVEEEDEASKKMKDHIKSCHDKQISVSMKKMSQCEIEKSPNTGKSKSQKLPTKSLDGEAVATSLQTSKKPEKKESSKAPSLKSASSLKSPKSKEEVPKPSVAVKKSGGGRPPAKKTTPAALKKKLAALSSDSDTDAKAKKKRKSYTEDSDSDDDDSEFEVNKTKRKPTLYCFESCFEEESNEMIG